MRGRLTALTALALASSGCYVLEQGRGQAQILLSRRPVAEVLHDAHRPPQERRALRVLLSARRFGVERLGLAGEDLYRTFYDTGDDPVAWNVSASPKDRLEAHRWWFPVVGSVPYLGFFDRAEAEAEAARLREADLDVLLRGVGAYSTLGWLSDPVFSSSLAGDAFEVARVVLHEMAHATVFLPGEVAWNENFATVVGDEGALLWLAARHGRGSRPVRAARARLAEEARYEAHMQAVIRRLRALYDSPLAREDKLVRREAIFADGKAGLARLQAGFVHLDRSGWLEREWSNALLLSFARYHAHTDALRRALAERFGGDLAAFVAHCRGLRSAWWPA